MTSLKKAASNTSHILGVILMCGGGAGLFVMAVVGTIAIDLVLLNYALKQRNQFLTGFVLGGLFFRQTPGPFLGISLLSTGIAVVLSVALGVPQVGALLLAGWAAAALVFSVGVGLCMLGETLDPTPDAGSPFRFSMAH